MRCLIVEEDQCNREFLRELLSDGATCDSAYGGLQAIDMFRDAHRRGASYDVVVVDAELPDLPGGAVHGAIRAWERQHGVEASERARVVFLTAPWRKGEHKIEVDDPLTARVARPMPYDAASVLGAVHELTSTPSFAVESAAEGDDREVAAAEPFSHARRRFLIIEEDRLSSELLREVLHEFGACETAASGHEGLRRFRQALAESRPFELVTVDVSLDDMDGHAVVDRLRRVEDDMGVPSTARASVIMTTAVCDARHCHTTSRKGNEGYITKPIHDIQLLHKLRELHVIDGAAIRLEV